MANYQHMQAQAFDINRQALDVDDYPLYPLMAGSYQQMAEQAFDHNGDLITPADTYSSRESASHYASHQSAYPALPTDVPFSSISDDYPAVPFLGAPAAPQLPFLSPVPSFDDDDANHDGGGFSWASQYPPVPSQYQYNPLPEYPHLPAQYPPLPTYPFTFTPPAPSPPSSPSPSDLALSDTSPSHPPSPTPSDLALSDYTPTPAPPSWTQTAAHHHLAPLTKYALVTRYAAEERAPPFRPRYYLPADKCPLLLSPLQPEPARRPAQKKRSVAAREDTPRPARPTQTKRKRSEVREETPQRPAPALRKSVRWVRKAVPAVRKAAAPRKVDKAAAAAPACKCGADKPVVAQPDDDVDMADADESEFDSGSEVGEPDSEYEEAAPAPRRRR